MAKHDFEFKEQVVHSYLRGDRGYRSVACAYGLDHATVSKWVKAYELHGQAGLRNKHSHYSAAFKLGVLQCIAHEHLSYKQACARFDIRGGTGVIAAWQRQYHAGGIEALTPKPKARLPKMMSKKVQPPRPQPDTAQASVPSDGRTLDAVLKENAYLRAEVAYLKKLRAWRLEQESAARQKRS